MPTSWHDHHDFLRYSKETKMHLKRIPVNARHTPQEVALYIDCLTTPRAGTPLLPTPAVLQATIVVTIRVDIHESLLKQNKKRISWWLRGLITVGSGNLSSSPTSSLTKSRITSPLREHLSPRSARRHGAQLGLRKREKNMRRSMDPGKWMSTAT